MRTTNSARLCSWAILATLGLLASVLLAGPAYAGSICRDGTWTASEGRGTCSHHGGVAQKGVPRPDGATVIGSGSTGVSSSAGTSTSTPDPLESGSGAAQGNDPAAADLSSGGRDAAIAVLSVLAVRPANVAGYARSKFRHWITQPDGCSTREAVLIRDATTVSNSGCRIISGSWFSPYDATTWTAASRLDIDHMVPLKEAWLSGASSWSADRRKSFANDMGWKGSLIAVSASSNRSKGDKDPARWMPPNTSYWCTYLFDWVDVKYRWSLSVDAIEKQAITKDLASCPDDGFTLAPLAP
ncbi:MAG: GmrSD restriction endonuclease domain-containing protein [Candidatus Nanopelagicales bacterium]